MKKILILILSLILLCSCTVKETEKPVENSKYSIASIGKHGNIIINKTIEEMKAEGIDITDIVTVTINGVDYEMPVGTLYTDVNPGNMIMRFDEEDNEVAIAINSGDFASYTGLFVKETIDEDPGYVWVCNVDNVTIDIALKSKQGYANEYQIKKLERSNKRSDYPQLSDEEYANFRAVFENVLYRSSSPIDPSIGRNTYADEACKNHQIKHMINLADTQSSMKEYEGYSNTYYSTCQITNIDTNYEFEKDMFKESIKETIKTIIDNDGPFLIHCKEGKDRTGIVCAIIEAFCGWSLEQIVEDYMITYCNFYDIEVGSEKYNLIYETIIYSNLRTMFSVNSLKDIDIKMKATEYLLSTGLNEEELTKLQNKLQITEK